MVSNQKTENLLKCLVFNFKTGYKFKFNNKSVQLHTKAS